ncbi:hypothetical protein DL89DRAFT_255661 [Linderina pennispora]|uniref:TFG box profile domain-containing protein n=1 Tax=Linderina pennispora TaxID=61395 RepID=A0A1Y1WEN8_9FUNG|nr:uncharacterized protein DL89DRAFT_255661 [Linderina pennispora]ORX71953.1 hypothetical protein DL89DRAFT_255661 [Linderina pennispora]
MSATVYGNRISLISKSGIRYTGTLNDVNEQEQTISLEQVRSMGTEGRKGNPLEEIPASNDIYEYIQFRATDVISVQFETEPAAPPPPPQVPNDPAILDARAKPREQPQQQPAQAAPVSQEAPAAAAPAAKPTPVDAPTGTQVESVTRDTTEEQDTFQRQSGYQRQQQGGRGGYRGRGGYQNGSNYRGGYRGRGGYQNSGGRGGYQQRQGGRRIEIPESDFDFESSNSKLNKDDIAKEFAKLSVDVTEEDESPLSNGSVPTAKNVDVSSTAYVPKKSFFDDISCETKERIQMLEHGLSPEERRSRLNAERQQNYETFGQTAAEQSRYRYNRYRGGHQGSRGGYHHNYNNNNNSGGGSWRGGRGGYSNRGSGYTNQGRGGYRYSSSNQDGSSRNEGYIESGAQA